MWLNNKSEFRELPKKFPINHMLEMDREHPKKTWNRTVMNCDRSNQINKPYNDVEFQTPIVSIVFRNNYQEICL